MWSEKIYGGKIYLKDQEKWYLSKPNLIDEWLFRITLVCIDDYIIFSRPREGPQKTLQVKEKHDITDEENIGEYIGI